MQGGTVKLREILQVLRVVTGESGERGDVPVTDDELVHQIRSKNTDALMELMDRYAGAAYSLCSRILGGVGSHEDVEECVSDVFHRAWQRIEEYDPGRAPLRTWLLILAKYEALRWRRELMKRRGIAEEIREDVPDPQTPEQELLTRERRAAVQAALSQLPELDRELIYRRYFLGESIDRLAAEYRLTRQAIDNRFWRGRKTLRDLLLPAERGVRVGET